MKVQNLTRAVQLLCGGLAYSLFGASPFFANLAFHMGGHREDFEAAGPGRESEPVSNGKRVDDERDQRLQSVIEQLLLLAPAFGPRFPLDLKREIVSLFEGNTEIQEIVEKAVSLSQHLSEFWNNISLFILTDRGTSILEGMLYIERCQERAYVFACLISKCKEARSGEPESVYRLRDRLHNWGSSHQHFNTMRDAKLSEWRKEQLEKKEKELTEARSTTPGIGNTPFRGLGVGFPQPPSFPPAGPPPPRST